MKIMIVDDSASMRMIVIDILRQLGFMNLQEAGNGQEALEKIRAEPVDFVISDWRMPVMSGIDLLRSVRADDALKHIPFLMMTAEVQKENIVQAVQSGVSSYIAKPFTADVFRQKLNEIFP